MPPGACKVQKKEVLNIY